MIALILALAAISVWNGVDVEEVASYSNGEITYLDGHTQASLNAEAEADYISPDGVQEAPPGRHLIWIRMHDGSQLAIRPTLTQTWQLEKMGDERDRVEP